MTDPIGARVKAFWNLHPVDGHGADPSARRAYQLGKEPWAESYLEEFNLLEEPLLDVGCGQGDLIADLATRGFRPLGGDLSFVSLTHAARDIRLRGRLVVLDARALPFRSNSLAAAVSLGVLHHSPDLARSLAEILRVLRPSASVKLFLYNVNSPKGMLVRLVRLIFSCVRAPKFRGGTALQELLVCPVLDLYSATEIKGLMAKFADLRLRLANFGLYHLWFLISGGRKWPALARFDIWMGSRFGFYLLIDARKP